MTVIPKSIFRGVVIASILVFLVAGIVLAPSHSAMAMAMYVVASASMVLLEYITWRIHFFHPRETPFGSTGLRMCLKTVAFSLIAAILLEAVTLYGAPLSSVVNISDWNMWRVLFFFIVSYSVCILVLVEVRECPYAALRRFKERLSIKSIVRMLFAVILAILIAAILGLFFSETSGIAFVSTFLFLSIIFVTILFFVAQTKHVASHPERYFFVAALLFGSYLVFVLPAETNISWDDQIHYKKSLALSYIVDSEYADSDMTLLNPSLDDESLKRPGIDALSESEVVAYHSNLNDLYISSAYHRAEGFGTAPEEASIASYATIGYVPSAIGLWVGRAFHLPYSLIFDMGRWANLFAYCLVSFFAIKIIPTRKILLCAVALLPTSLFLAANYSYDPWLISLLFLAVALVVRELSAPNIKLTVRSWIAMLLVFLVGLGPKAIYFPLIGLLFLLPKEKFVSSRQRRLFILSVVVLGCIVVASFLLPFVSSGGASASDMRGGLDVSSSGQLRYILSDPLGYASMLLSFLANNFLNLLGSDGYTVMFAYLGHLQVAIPWFATLPTVLLLLIALTDVDSVSEKLARIPYAVWMAFLFLVTVCLIVSSLYISFTPVGSDTVNGCQHRYLLPLVFPLLAFCFNLKMKNNVNRKMYNLSAISLSTVPMVLCCWYLVASKIAA